MNDPRTLKFVFSIAKLANKYVLGKLTHTHKCWVKKKTVKNAVQRKKVLYRQDTLSHGGFICVSSPCHAKNMVPTSLRSTSQRL